MVVLHGSFVCFSTSWHLHAPHGRLLGVGGLFDLAGCGPFLCTRGLNIRPNKSNCQNPAVPEPHGEILSQPLMLDRSHLECDCLPQLFLRVSGVPMAHGVETHSYAKCFAGKFRSEKYKEETAGAAERNPAQFQETTRAQPAGLPQPRWKSKLPAQPLRNSQPSSALRGAELRKLRSRSCPNAKQKPAAPPRAPFPCLRIPFLFVELRTRSLAHASRHKRKQGEAPALPILEPPIS